MSDDLRKLIEAVEADHYVPQKSLPFEDPCGHVLAAMDGSVDAAIALCEALLPGWVATVGTVGYAIVCENETKITRHASALLSRQPARALLLAVLRAKLMEASHE